MATYITSMDNWVEDIDSYFTESEFIEAEPEPTPVYTGDFLDINVRTYHLKKYPFKDEYHLEIKYLNEDKSTSGHLIPTSTKLENIIKQNIKNISASKYKARISINGKLHKTIE